MAIFGLGTDDKPAPKKVETKADDKKPAATSQSDEAKAMLEKMKAKNDSGDCAFC